MGKFEPVISRTGACDIRLLIPIQVRRRCLRRSSDERRKVRIVNKSSDVINKWLRYTTDVYLLNKRNSKVFEN